MNVFHRHKPKHLAQDRDFTTRVLLGFLGAQAFFLPFAGTAAASGIAKSDGKQIASTGGVYHIYADKMDGENAMSRFSAFSLDRGRIANMRFQTEGADAYATRLFNFVDGPIDIQGTVNAVNSSKGLIGGQLFFLSHDGITVGPTGVINAGAINLLTPSKSAYDKLLDENNMTLSEMAKNVTGNAYAVNPEATIEVAGQLNAVDGIKLRTANIKLESTAQLRTGTAVKDADGNVTDVTDAMDFSQLVNIDAGNGQGTISGLAGGTLTASTDASGDIVLSAISSSTVTAPSEEKAADELAANFTPMERTATIETADGSTILARGSANIYATATNADEGWSHLEEGGYHVELSNPLGQVVFTKADIQLSGNITAKNNIDVEALSSNEYKSDNDTTSIESWGRATGARWTNHLSAIQWLHDTLNLRPIYSYMDSEANVTALKTAKLEALNKSGKGIGDAGSGLLLSASSTAVNKVYASSTSKQAEITGGVKAKQSGSDKAADETTKETHPTQTTTSGEKRTHLAGAAISYDGAYSSANVTALGTVKAKNDVAMQATSKTDVKAKASENGAPSSSGSTSAKMNAAVAVLTGGNHSNVTVADDAKVESTDGSVAANAHTENKFETIASVTSNSNAVGATAVGVNVFDSDATVEVLGTLKSKGDTTLSAESDTPVNGVTVSNETLAAPPVGDKTEPTTETTLTDEEAANTLFDREFLIKFLSGDTLNNVYHLAAKAAAADAEKQPTTSISDKISQYADFLTAGASVGVGVSDINADVKVGKKANIDAGGALSVTSNALLEDIYMSSTSAMTNTDPDRSNAMVGAAVMVSDAKNNANVTIADGTADAGDHATLKSSGTLTVTADSTQTYDRVGGILYDLDMLYSGLEALLSSDEYKTLDPSDQQAYKSQVEQVGKVIQDLNATKSVTGLDITSYTTNLSSFPTSLSQGILQVGSLLGGVQKIFGSLTNPNGPLKAEADAFVRSFQNQFLVWLQPESYFHYSVDSSVSNAPGTDGGNLAVAGAVNVNLLGSAANVDIGKNAVLTSDAGAVDIETNVAQNTAILNGKPNVGIDPDDIPDHLEAIVYGDGDLEERMKNLFTQWKDMFYVTPNTDAPNAVGGVVGVAEHSTASTVAIGTGAQVTGHDATVDVTDDAGKVSGTKDISGVNIQAESSSNTVDISFGAGKSGKIGFEGLLSWLGGSSKNAIDIDGATLRSFAKDPSDAYGNVNLYSHTNNVLTNLVGAIAWGSGGASMGASVGILDYGTVNDITVKNSDITAGSLDTNALTDGVLNNVAVTGSLTTEGAKEPQDIEMDDENAIAKIEDAARDEETEMVDMSDYDFSGLLDDTSNPSQGSFFLTGTKTAKGASQNTHFQLAGSGGVAVNIVKSETKATMDGNTVNIQSGAGTGSDGNANDGHVNQKAEDASYAGAYTGAAALNWQQTNAKGTLIDRTKTAVKTDFSTKDGKQKEVIKVQDDPVTQETKVSLRDGTETSYKGEHATAAIAGVVAMNYAEQTVASEIKNTKIQDASSVRNIAQKDGAAVAAGLSLAASKKNADEGASAFDLSAAASFNEVNSNVDATISDGSEITTKENSANKETGTVANVAYDSDTQVAGGANVSFVRSGKTSAAAGAMVSINDVHNTVGATLKDSKITAEGGKVQNNAAEDLTQIGTSIGIAAATGGQTGIAMDLTLASDNAENKLNATIEGTELKAGAVDNAAYDASDLDKTFDQVLENNSVNVTGSTYTENATKNAATEGGKESDDFRNRDYDIHVDSKGSTKQIAAAFSLTGSSESGGGAGAAAVAISTLRDEKTAAIQSSTITATDVANAAASNALLVHVVAGASVTRGTMSGAGSGSVQHTSNKTIASIDDTTITADTLDVSAKSNDLGVNVAGQAGYGSNGIGLSIAFNHLGNTTGAYLRGSDVKAASDNGAEVAVSADNSDTIVSVAVSANGGQTAAVNGALAANQGNDDAEAVIDESTTVTDATTGKKRRTNIEKARKLTAKADDNSTKVAVAGAINGAGTAAVGGGIAYNEIGDWTENGDATYYNDREQQTHAAVNHADITTVASDTAGDGVTVSTTDNATIGTAATGIGASGAAAVDGAAAISVVARESYAEMTDTNVQKADGQAEGANVNVTSASEGSIYNNALVIAAAADAAVGAGVAVDYDNTDNTAKIAGGTITAKDLRVDAETKDKILNIGVGGTGSAYAGVTGSVSVNILGGHTRAGISDTALDGTNVGGANVTSDSNVIVDAKRSGSIDNLSGVAAVSGTGASVGLSVAVNDIQNEVSSEIAGSTTAVTAKGGTAETVDDTVDDDAFLTAYPADISDASKPAAYMTRKASNYSGVAVSASSTNEIHDYTVNGGANAIGASVNGNVTVNAIGGKTTAAVTAGAITADSDQDGTGDLHVVAHDAANNTAYTGAFNVSGLGAGIGIGTTTLTVSRETSATMTGTKGSSAAQAETIGLDADSKFAVANITAAVGGAAFAGVEAVNNNTLLKGTTTASASGYDMTAGNSLDVSATHGTNIYTVGISAGVGAGAAGLGIDVVQDDSQTTAALKDGSVTTKTKETGDVTVAAESSTHDNYKMVALTGGAVGVSTNVSVSNFDAKTTAHVKDMTIGSSATRAGAVDIHAKNDTQVTSDAWDGSASGIGIGAGIQIATIGSDTDTRVENSSIAAKTIDIKADDTKNANFQLGNTLAGGIAGGVNVGVLTAGHKVENSYSIEGNDSGADLSDVFSTNGDVNKALVANRVTADQTIGTGVSAPSVQTNNGTDSGKADAATTTAAVTGGTLDASDDVNVTSNATVKVKEENIYAAASLGSFSGQVGVLDDAKQAEVRVNGAKISGSNVAIGTNLSGTSALDMYQGADAGIAASGAFAFARSANSQGIALDGSTINATGTVNVKTADDSKTTVHAYAVQPTFAGAASFQLAEADVVGSTNIALGKGNDITANTIDIEAKSAPTIETDVRAANASLVFTGGVGISTIETGDNTKAYETKLAVADENKLAADSVRLAAIAAPTETSNLKALSLAGGTSITVNDATNRAYSNVTADIGNVQYGSDKKAAALTITAENNPTQTLSAASAEAAGLAAVANNTANIVNVTNTTATAKGAATGSNLKSVTIGATQNATAKAGASSYGGSILAAVSAAETELSHKGTTTANVSGTWDTAGDFNVTAKNNEKFNLDTDTASAAIVDGSGGGLTTDIDETARVTMGAAVTTTGAQAIRAENASANTNTTFSGGFGFLGSTDATRLAAKANYTGDVALTGATLLAKGGDITAAAATTGTHATDNNITAGSTLLTETVANTTNDLTYKNAVTTNGATVKTQSSGDVALAAYDATKASDTILADSEGLLAAASSAHIDTNLTRANNVTIGGNSAIESASDARLAASRKADGTLAGTQADITSETYNRTFIPFDNDPDIDAKFDQANTVTVDAGSSVASVEDTAIAADAGEDSQHLSAKRYTIYDSKDGSITTTKNGAENGSGTVKNKATINGTVTAGIHDAAVVNITGKAKAGEPSDDGTIVPTDFSDVKVTVEQGSDWLDADAFEKETFYGMENPFLKEYQSLIASQADYPEGTDARKNIDAEITSLCESMERMGYAEKRDGKYIIYKTFDVAYIHVPDIKVSGGNVDVSADALAIGSTGKVTAKNGSAIDITSNSNVALFVNDAIIPQSGGNVYFNHAKVNKETSVSGLTGADRIETADTSAAPEINIKSTGGFDEDLGHGPDIVVQGNIENEAGAVTIETLNGSVRIAPVGNVSGATVTIRADNGNVVQTGVQETDIGGNPITQWLGDADNREAIQRIFDWDMQKKGKTTTYEYETFDAFWTAMDALCAEYNKEHSTEPLTLTKPSGESDASSGVGILAGGDIIISGHDVNLGGLVQSGYADYTVKLDDAAVGRMAELDANYGNRTLTDEDVRGDFTYYLMDHATYYDTAAKCWKYQPTVYYNPTTKHIVIGDISAKGGNVTIRGRLASTSGNSRILVASGAANIDIDTTKVDHAVSLGTITNRNRTGTVTLLDTVQNQSFRQTFDKPLATDALFNYQTDGVQRSYTWTGGVTTYTKTHHERKETEWLFHSITEEDFYNKYDLDKDTKVSTEDKKDAPLSEQTHIKDVSLADHPELKDSAAFTVSTQLTQSDEKHTDVKTTADKKGLWGLIKTEYTYTWETEKTTGTSTVYTVKGDNAIHINGLAPTSGSGIHATANGSVLVDHNITSASPADDVTLTSQAGEVKGSGTIATDKLTATAAKGIDLTQAALQNSDTATVDLTTQAGDVTLDSHFGNLLVAGAKSAESDGNGATVAITSSQDILGAANAATANDAAISASRILLTAANGKIGTKDNALTVQVGKLANTSAPESPSLNATAYGDITLTATGGDLPVDQIASQTGDVRLTAENGSITNASDDTITTETPADALIEKWKDAGIISRKDKADSNANAKVESQAARLAAFEKRLEQLALRNQETRRLAGAGNYTAEANRTSENYKTAAEAYATDATLSTARDAYISSAQAAETTADAAQAKQVYIAAIQTYFDGLADSYDTDERTAISHYGEALVEATATYKNAYGWAKNDLLNAVSDRIVNKQPGDVRLPDAANITGKTIALAARDGIGTPGTKETIAKADLAANIQKLRDTYPGNAVWNYDENGELVSITIDTSRPLYVKSSSGDTADISLSSHGATYLGTTTGQALALHAADADATAGATDGDMVLLAAKGITSGGLTLKADNMTIYAGDGNIGTAANAIDADIHGTLQANAKGSLYLKNQNADGTKLSAITVGDDIELTSKGSITMEQSDANTNKNTTKLTAGDKINLTSETGDIGEKDNALRIAANGAAVSALAKNGDVALAGKGSGTLVIDDVTAQDVTVTIGGNVALARAAADGKTATNADITAKTMSIDAKAIDLTDGSVTITGDKDSTGLALTSDTTITQGDTSASKIVADAAPVTLTTGTAATADAEATAGGTIRLASKQNDIHTISVRATDAAKGLAGTVAITTTAPNTAVADGLTVTFGAGPDGTAPLTVASTDTVTLQNLAPHADLTIGGELTTTSGNIAFASNGDLNVLAASKLTSANDLTLKAADDANIAGDVQADGNLMVDAGGDANMTSEATITKDVTINAGGNATVSKEVNADNVSVTAGKDANVTGTIEATKDVKVNAGNDATLTGNVAAGGDVTVKATNGNATLSGTTTGENIEVTAGNHAISTGTTEAANDLILEATNGDATLGGKSSAKTATVKAGHDAKLTGVALVTDVTLAAGHDAELSGAALNNDGTVNDVSIVAGHDAKLDGLTQANNVSILAENNATYSGLASVTRLTIDAGKDATVDGDVTAEKDVTVEADRNATLDGTASGKNITIQAGGNATATGDLIANEDVKVAAGGNAIVAGDVDAAQDVNVHADKNATLGGDVTAEDVTVTASRNADLKGSIEATGDVTVDADGNAILRGTTTAENVAVDAGGNALLLKDVNVTNDVTVGAGKNATLTGTVEAGNNVSVNAGSDTMLKGNVDAKGDVTVHADNDATLSGTTTATNIAVTAGGNASLLKDVKATNDVTVGAGKNATLLKDVEATKDVTIEAGKNAMLDGTVEANNVAVNAGGDTTLKGNVEAKGDVNVHAGDDALVDGDVTAENLTVTAGNNATIAGTAVVEKDLRLAATTGDATLSGKTSSTTATVAAGHDAAVTGLAVVTDVNVEAGHDATISGAAVGNRGTNVNDVNIHAGHDATIDGLIAQANSIDMTAGNDTTFVGIASTKDLTIDAGRDATLGGLSGTHDVRVSAGDNISMDTGYDTFRTTGILSLTAGNEIGLGSTKNLVSGSDMTLRAGADLIFDSAISEHGNLLAASGGLLSIDTIGGPGTRRVLVSGDRVLSDAVTSAGNVDVLAYHGMDLGYVTAGGNAHIDGLGEGDMTIRGGDVKGEAYVRSNIAGDLDVSNFHSDGMARYVTRDGNMTLSYVSSDHRIGIYNYGRDKTTLLDHVSAKNLLSFLAFHPTIIAVDAPVVFNILTAGDPARRAIGWQTAGDVHHQLLDAADFYRLRRDWDDIGTFIDYEPATPFLGLPENATEGDVVVEDEGENDEATM